MTGNPSGKTGTYILIRNMNKFLLYLEVLLFISQYLPIEKESINLCGLLLQVSFVFTKQVNGKLVPVESAVRSNKEEVGPKNQLNSKANVFLKSNLSSQNQAPFPLLSSNGIQNGSMSPNPFKLLQKPLTKLIRPSEGETVTALTHKLSPGNQLPQKRIFTDNKIDDDFE